MIGIATMTEEALRDMSQPALGWENGRLRAMVRECDRRSAVLRGLVDSSPFEPWQFCSPDELKAARVKMLERMRKGDETLRQTAARIEAEQWNRGKRGSKS